MRTPRIAFNLLWHKNAAQCLDLLAAIHDPADLYLIHLSRSAETGFAEAVRDGIRRAGYSNNVAFQARRRVRWGSADILNTMVAGMRESLHRFPSWDYYINLSGQDYPLWSLGRIRAGLGEAGGRSFLEVASRAEWPEIEARLVRHNLAGRSLPAVPGLRRAIPADITFYGGAAWGVLSRAFCEHVASDAFAARLLKHFRLTPMPDELFFQTVLMNSPFREVFINDSRRHVQWAPHDCGHPEILSGEEDFARLAASSAFFARKFDREIDPHILDRVHAELVLGRG